LRHPRWIDPPHGRRLPRRSTGLTKTGALPQAENAAWVRNPIDAFVLARIEKEDDAIAWKPPGKR
jgi:hypothetical protein